MTGFRALSGRWLLLPRPPGHAPYPTLQWDWDLPVGADKGSG